MGRVLTLREFASEDDARISGATHALITGRGLLPEYVATQIGMTKSSIYSKLRGSTPWKASEVAAVARFLQVRVGDLYDGLDGRFGPTPPSPATAGATAGAGREWAPRGSNSQPAD